MITTLGENYITNDQGEPTVSYKWTGWVWEITGWRSRLQENYRSFYRNLLEIIMGGGTSKSTPILFYITETLHETKWEHWSTMYTYIDYQTFVQCNIVTLKHWKTETLKITTGTVPMRNSQGGNFGIVRHDHNLLMHLRLATETMLGRGCMK